MERKIKVINKFKPKDNYDKNRQKVKREMNLPKKEKKVKTLIENSGPDKKENEEESMPNQVIVKFVSMEGKALNENSSSMNEITIPTLMTFYDLNTLMNEKLRKKEEKVSYLFFLNDIQIKGSVNDTLKKLKDFNSESVYDIVYCPESLFRVKPLTRGGSILEGHTDSILTVQFSPDGKLLASGGGDCTVRFWDILTDTPIINEVEGHKNWVLCLSFSPCGSYLASGGVDGTMILWDCSTCTQLGLPIRAHSKWITSIAWKPLHLDADCRSILTSGKDGYLKLWDLQTKHCQLSILAHDVSITKAIWSGENFIYSSSQDQTIKVFDEDLNFVKVLTGHAHWINTMAINTEHILKTGCYDYESNIQVNTNNREEMQQIALKRYQKFKLNINSSEKLVTGSDDFTLILWDPMISDKPLVRMTGHQQLINHVAFSPNAFYLASASFDKCIKIWNANTGSFLFNLRSHVGPVYQIAWSPNSKMLLSGSKDSSLICWNIEAKKLMHNLAGHADEVYCVDWSPNGEKAASGSKDRRLRIWVN